MRNIMMHVLNFMWLGGVPMFVRDMIRVYPEFHHAVCYLNDKASFGGEDYEMMQEWEYTFGVDIGYAPLLTREGVESVDPAVLVLHGTPGRAIEGEWPFAWVNERPTIFVHHMPTRPLLKVDLNLFVSEFLFERFKSLADRMRCWRICPPVIDTDAYTPVAQARDYERKTCTIAKLCSDWNAKKYPAQLTRVMSAVAEKHEHTRFEIVGGAKHYNQTAVPRLTMPPVQAKPVPDFMRDIDVFLYINEPELPETWCRSVTEAMASGLPVVAENRGGIAEQIEHGENGFLCETDEEFIDCLDRLASKPGLRWTLGRKAHVKASARCGLDKLREATIDVVLGALTGTLR